MGALDRIRSKMSGADVEITRKTTAEIKQTDSELRNFRKQHRWDPFLDVDKLDKLDSAIASGDVEKEDALDHALIQDDSPYPEVRSSVPPTDVDMPVNTIRSWTLGVILCTIVAACNILLQLRATPISITSTVVQLISYPMGVAWAKYFPAWRFTIFGKTLELNPGPFNVKEHTIITLMTAAGSTYSYAISILLAQERFYHQNFGWGFQILLIISTQAMGFGIAGVARRFLIWPSSMVWPAVLITTTVMYSLHDHSPADPTKTNGWQIGRYAFFVVVAASTFVWEWVPQVLATFMQYFMFPVWAAPNNVVVNQIFGGQSGLGIIPISFDWSVVTGFLGSPLQTPAFAIVNVTFGVFLVAIGCIGLNWGGPELFKYLPLSANKNFDHFAQKYNVSRIMNIPEYTINMEKYEAYSPILIGPAFSLSYGFGFAALMATITHIALFYGPDVWRRARDSRSEEDDVHMKLMRKYKEAPEWWFMAIFAVNFAFGLIASQVWPTHMPWWSYIIAILIGSALFIPIGIIQAITNQQVGLNIVTEMIFGYMLPGRPVAMMLFKSWGYMLAYNGLTYVSDMKVGHYMKIPPRSTFAAQAFAVVWLSIVQICTYNFLMGNIEGICTDDQPQGLTCPTAVTFYNASVIWGVIGPKIVFGAGALYSWCNYFWLIGFLCPLIQFLIARKYPRSWVRYVVFPAIFGAAGQIPPATTWNLFIWCWVGLAFNVVIRRLYRGWWTQYTYVLSGALDIGTALCVVIVGLGLGLSGTPTLKWWGNDVVENNLDFHKNATTRRLAPGEKIPGVW
ncbi:Putative Oligopeptide transporter OPT-like protein [[Torrubiella] hemipterigena]|uniref:Putative Oligopeptide transporter OPT-like protein n=1 Tax=[Torrubiella] hemipterigena TaxID=1531966 RepID=A0A0A1TM20_9HYPO|nr:Putative Oligopeptide transporter OPT-like protein [[Torrubiella] hemipterigena]